ncbi:hypothetical protein ACPF7Z_09515 [Halomonas sp. GXIMD04776]|uniref:hypothetical protein n=1 Tax=Halomonas sp. GXIMD04776 TaxID=3415605 RepID=UPI003CADD7B6
MSTINTSYSQSPHPQATRIHHSERIGTFDPGNAKKVEPSFKLHLDSLRNPDLNKVADNSDEKIYSQIEKNGKIVATIYDGGIAKLSGAYGHLSLDSTSANLAERRTQQIADLIGGTIHFDRD